MLGAAAAEDDGHPDLAAARRSSRPTLVASGPRRRARSDGVERGPQVGDQVGGVLDAAGEPDEPGRRRRPRPTAPAGRRCCARRRSWSPPSRAGSRRRNRPRPPRRRARPRPPRSGRSICRASRARSDGSSGRHGQRTPLHRRVLREQVGHGARRSGRLPGQPQVQRAHRPVRQPRLERAGSAPVESPPGREPRAQPASSARAHVPEQQVAVPGQRLGVAGTTERRRPASSGRWPSGVAVVLSTASSAPAARSSRGRPRRCRRRRAAGCSASPAAPAGRRPGRRGRRARRSPSSARSRPAGRSGRAPRAASPGSRSSRRTAARRGRRPTCRPAATARDRGHAGGERQARRRRRARRRAVSNGAQRRVVRCGRSRRRRPAPGGRSPRWYGAANTGEGRSGAPGTAGGSRPAVHRRGCRSPSVTAVTPAWPRGS